jgi:hypothetical protein
MPQNAVHKPAFRHFMARERNRYSCNRFPNCQCAQLDVQFLCQSKVEEFRSIDLLVAQNFSRLSRALRAANADHNSITENTDNVLDRAIANVMGTEAAIAGVELLSGASIVVDFPSMPFTMTLPQRFTLLLRLQAHMR